MVSKLGKYKHTQNDKKVFAPSPKLLDGYFKIVVPTIFSLMQTGVWIAGGAVHTAFSKGKGFIELNLRKFPGKTILVAKV